MKARSTPWVLLILGTCLVLFMTIAHARPEVIHASEKHVSVDLRDIDISEALKYFAKRGRFNVFVSSNVQGKVSIYLRDVTINNVLDILVQSYGLAYRQIGSVLNVMTQEEYLQRYGEPFSQEKRVRSVRLRYAEPADVFRMLDPVKSRQGSVVIDEKTGMLILVDRRDKVSQMLRLIHELDQPLRTRVFDLRYSKAADAQQLLLAQLDVKSLVSIHADPRSNQLVVTAPAGRMREIARILRGVDRKTREVAIDAEIVKVALNKDNSYGVTWKYLFSKGFLKSTNFNVNLPQALTSFGSVGFGVAGTNDLQLIINFLLSLGNSKILASPHITVVDGGQASILIGTREAYVTTTTTNSGSGVSSTAESVSFIDVGISLNVSPIINRDGYVTMKVKPEVSSVTRELTTPSNNQIPIVDTTQAETQVMVKDGTTLVIGGLRKDERIYNSNRIPYLSDIPLVGWLFKQKSDALDQSELIVFLTPHVIGGDKNTEERLERRFKGAQSYLNAPPSMTNLIASPVTGVGGSKGLGLKTFEPYRKG